VVDVSLLRDVAAKAPRGLSQTALHQTGMTDDILAALDEPALLHVCAEGALRGQLADILSEVRFPEQVWQELDSMRREDPQRLQHGVWTALVSARMFGAALGEAPGLLRLVGGSLVHDIGMRHAAPRLRWKRDHLSKGEAHALEDHP